MSLLSECKLKNKWYIYYSIPNRTSSKQS